MAGAATAAAAAPRTSGSASAPRPPPPRPLHTPAGVDIMGADVWAGERAGERAGREAEERLLTALSARGLGSDALFPALRVPRYPASTADRSASVSRPRGRRPGRLLSAINKPNHGSNRPALLIPRLPLPSLPVPDNPGHPDTFVVVESPAAAAKRYGRAELDVVAVTRRGVFLLEVKYWSGFVSPSTRPGADLDLDLLDPALTWVQTRSDSRQTFHANPLLKVLEKKQWLEEHLGRHGVHPVSVQPRIVFLHPHTELAPELRHREEVVSPAQVQELLASLQTSVAASLSDHILPAWLSGCQLPPSRARHIARVLAETTGTWDKLRLRGCPGQVAGDFIGLELPSSSGTPAPTGSAATSSSASHPTSQLHLELFGPARRFLRRHPACCAACVSAGDTSDAADVDHARTDMCPHAIDRRASQSLAVAAREHSMLAGRLVRLGVLADSLTVQVRPRPQSALERSLLAVMDVSPLFVQTRATCSPSDPAFILFRPCFAEAPLAIPFSAVEEVVLSAY